jgi:hypothetical protein
MTKKNDYTVIGIYADTQEPWMEHVKNASDPKEAAIQAINKLSDRSGADPDDMYVLEVIEGIHSGTLNNDNALNLDGLRRHTL